MLNNIIFRKKIEILVFCLFRIILMNILLYEDKKEEKYVFNLFNFFLIDVENRKVLFIVLI